MDKHITIMWEGPYSYGKVVSERDDLGLYQIYGPHELYSNKKRPTVDKVLLYIGKTVSKGFSDRILAQGFCHDSDYEIFLGRIEGNENDVKSWEWDVEDAEKLLINKYAPPYNAQFVSDIERAQLHNQDCVIINHGCKSDLDEMVRSEEVVYHTA